MKAIMTGFKAANGDDIYSYDIVDWRIDHRDSRGLFIITPYTDAEGYRISNIYDSTQGCPLDATVAMNCKVLGGLFEFPGDER